MKALTVWQPWASLIMAGAKPYEFRRWAAPRWIVGQRIVIHAGARRMRDSEIVELLNRLDAGEDMGLVVAKARELVERVWRKRVGSLGTPACDLPLAHGLGTAVIGEPRRATEIYTGRSDSDRIDEHVWGWPLTDIQPFEPPVPCKGLQGFWTWPKGLA